MVLGVASPVFSILCTLTTATTTRTRGHEVDKAILNSFLPHESSISIESASPLPSNVT